MKISIFVARCVAYDNRSYFVKVGLTVTSTEYTMYTVFITNQATGRQNHGSSVIESQLMKKPLTSFDSQG